MESRSARRGKLVWHYSPLGKPTTKKRRARRCFPSFLRALRFFVVDLHLFGVSTSDVLTLQPLRRPSTLRHRGCPVCPSRRRAARRKFRRAIARAGACWSRASWRRPDRRGGGSPC